MQFLVGEVGARIVAIVLGVYCYCEIRQGIVRRTITSVPDDIGGFLLDSSVEFRRDVTPVLYWTEMVLKAVALLACMFVAVFGWS